MVQQIKSTEIILYVEDRARSRQFYEALLKCKPILDVPGMTEFELGINCKLGLMPNEGIATILKGATPHPATGNGIPRCELYLIVSDVKEVYAHAMQAGAKLISSLSPREWGDTVCYFTDPDGHVIAFAEKTK
jgi:catechol 2,3-dioxygenase-like lactoylglutathione lyase family enzyme